MLLAMGKLLITTYAQGIKNSNRENDAGYSPWPVGRRILRPISPGHEKGRLRGLSHSMNPGTYSRPETTLSRSSGACSASSTPSLLSTWSSASSNRARACPAARRKQPCNSASAASRVSHSPL